MGVQSYNFNLSGDQDSDNGSSTVTAINSEDSDHANNNSDESNASSSEDNQYLESDSDQELIFDSDIDGDGVSEASSVYPDSEYSEKTQETDDMDEEPDQETDSGDGEMVMERRRMEERRKKEEEEEEWEIVPPSFLHLSFSLPPTTPSRTRYSFKPQFFGQWISYREPPVENDRHLAPPRLAPGMFSRGMRFAGGPCPYTQQASPLAPLLPGCRDAPLDNFVDKTISVEFLMAEFRAHGFDMPFHSPPPSAPAASPYRSQQRHKNKPRCRFCIQNGEEAIYHIFKDEDGRVLCPVLSEYQCKLCGATGTHAHTLKYCPRNKLTRGNPVAAGMSPGLMPTHITLDTLRDL